MTDTAWTPGPWPYKPTGDGKRITIGAGLVEGPNGYEVAEVYSDDCNMVEAAANARLIAAAPEMAELLEELASDLEAETNARFGFPGETSPYLSENQRKRRDMEPVFRTRALLARIRGDAP